MPDIAEAQQSEPKVLVSAAMPCLNEEKSLDLCIEKVYRAFSDSVIAGEVVLLDNGSSDDSVRLARSPGPRVVNAAFASFLFNMLREEHLE